MQPDPPPGNLDHAANDSAGHDEDPCSAPALSELCRCHEHFEEVLDLLRGLAPHLQRQGPDEQARHAAARVLAFVDAEAPAHRAKEEREVFPVLRRFGGPAGSALAGRLEAEHGLLARAWGQCRPGLVELATFGRWSKESAAFEYERWRDFAALATAHMLAEHGAAFPAVLALMKGLPPPL